MKVEVAVLGSPPLTVLMVSEDVKQHLKNGGQELCESGGGRPGLPLSLIVHMVSADAGELGSGTSGSLLSG